MKDMRRVGFVSRNEQFVVVCECIVVVRSCTLPCGDVLVQMRSLGIQNSRLNRIQTTVDSDLIMVIAHMTAVVGKCPHSVCKHIVVREDGTAVSVTT